MWKVREWLESVEVSLPVPKSFEEDGTDSAMPDLLDVRNSNCILNDSDSAG